MKIYIDFDDVICETGRYFTKIAKDLFDIELPYSEVRFFNLQKAFKLDDEQYDEMLRVGHLPEILLSYEETPGASETINRWLDEGHEISIITGRPFDSYEPSRQWLDMHHLERVPLFCVDKYGRENFNKDCSYSMTLDDLYSMTFDFAVEDSPAAFQHVMHFENCSVAVFDRPWNKEAELPNGAFKRCMNWEEIDAYLQSVNAVEYKIAAREDIETLMDIRLEMLRVVNNLSQEYEYPETLVSHSRSYFLEGNQTTVLAFANGKAIGCASISYIEVMPTFSHPTGKRAHLMNVYTNADYRRRGISRRMVNMLIKEAKEKGATEISLDATESGRPLYEALGFSASESGMVMNL